MKRPPEVSLNIRAECYVYPSEDSAKVIKAVKNVLNNCAPELTKTRYWLYQKMQNLWA